MHRNPSSILPSNSSSWKWKIILALLCCGVIFVQLIFFYHFIQHHVHDVEQDILSEKSSFKKLSETAQKLYESESKLVGGKGKNTILDSIEKAESKVVKNMKDTASILERQKRNKHFFLRKGNVLARDAEPEEAEEKEKNKNWNLNVKNDVVAGNSDQKEEEHQHQHERHLSSSSTNFHFTQKVSTEFPNIHTAPLDFENDPQLQDLLVVSRNSNSNDNNKRKEKRDDGNGDDDSLSHFFPPLSQEAKDLIEMYSDIEPSHDDDDFIASLLVPSQTSSSQYSKSSRNSNRRDTTPKIRSELADLLRRVLTLNKNMRNLNLDNKNSNKNKNKNKRRVVIVHPVGQLCNRLVSITSAFVFALLTKRALFVDDEGFYCKSNDLFLKPGFDWTDGGSARIESGEYSSSSARDVVILENPEVGDWEMTEPLLCSNYSSSTSSSSSKSSSSKYRKFASASTIVFRTNQYIVPYMQRNPVYRAVLESLFPSSLGGVFHVLSHFLFRPLPSLLKQRDEFMEKHFDGNFVVGLQVRGGGDFAEHPMTEFDWKLYGNCALAASSSNNNQKKKKKKKKLVVFVATDTAKGRENAHKVLSSHFKKIFSQKQKHNENQEKDDHVNDSFEIIFGPGEFLLSNHPRGVQKALLDLLLLEQADDRVATAWSTFGYFAAGRSGIPSNLVVDEVPENEIEIHHHGTNNQIQRYMGIKHKSDRKRQCVRLPTVQPCFHHFENWGASKASCSEKNWLKEEMLGGRYC